MKYYLRFGDIPENECSQIHRGGEVVGEEKGVSVYPAQIHRGKIYLGVPLPLVRSTWDTLSSLVVYDSRPCFLVTGNEVGTGTDGEPLLRNVKIIRQIDWK